MSWAKKFFSIKTLKRVALWAWESMPVEDRIEFLDTACRRAGLNIPNTITTTIGETLYRKLPAPGDKQNGC
jgi:hypothetical protein